MEILAKRLLLLRKQHDLKQTEVAEKLGISISAYCRYEYGERDPLAPVLVRIAALYGVSTDYLLGLED